MQKVNLTEKLDLFSDHWKPRVVGELNGQHVKVVKLKGEFVWHRHEQADELFLVIRGHLRIEMRDQAIGLDEGEFFIVPKGVLHRTVAGEEAQALLFEPAGTINTGDVREERTEDRPEEI